MLFQRRKTRLGSLQGTSFFPQENAMKLLRQLSQILTREKERKSGFCLLEIIVNNSFEDSFKTVLPVLSRPVNSDVISVNFRLTYQYCISITEVRRITEMIAISEPHR